MTRPKLTRIDSTTLAAKVEKCARLMGEIETELGDVLVTLTEAERQTMPRTREGFEAAARTMARAMTNSPEIGAVADFVPAAVVEDLDNAQAILPITERARSLAQRIEDTRITWLAEAWVPALVAYGVAKMKAKSDGKVREVVEALAPIFAMNRGRKQEPKP